MKLRKANQAGQTGRHLPLGNLSLNLLISACPQGQCAGLACQSARRKGSYPLTRNARDICTWARQFFSEVAAVVKLSGSFEFSGWTLPQDFGPCSAAVNTRSERSTPEASNRACPDFRRTATCVDTHRSRQQKVGSSVRPGCLRQAGCRVTDILHSYGEATR